MPPDGLAGMMQPGPAATATASALTTAAFVRRTIIG